VRLFFTPNSPYARIARVAAREFSIEVEEVAASNRQPDNPVLEFSPVGRVPTLVDGNLVITEARHVVAYLRDFVGLPREASDWTSVAQDGLIAGFLEGICAWVRENRRSSTEKSATMISVERDRASRCLNALEAEAISLPALPAFRAIALTVALELMGRHRLVPTWRRACPRLAGWLDQQLDRPSMRSTRPQD